MSGQGDMLEQAEPACEFGNKPGIPDIRHEMLLLERIRQFRGPSLLNLFDGDTDELVRAQRIRRAILDRDIADAIAGATTTRPRKALTFAQAFERLYGEPLIPTQRKGKR